MQIKDKAYSEHRVFKELDQYAKFYKDLSMSVFSFITMGTKSLVNIDTYVLSSMQGTLESIKVILIAGRINDAYALLRKYHDSTIINVYSNLYLKDHFSIENFVVEKINNWLRGKEKLPEYRKMSEYIRASESLKVINELLYGDSRYKTLRELCNDNTHYNFYHNLMLNDNEVYIKARGLEIEKISVGIRDIFILHLAYIFFLNDHYMMSSDYVDYLDCGMQPEENSQFWVAPFIQEIFDTTITPHRPDIAAAIKNSTSMQLN